MENDFQLSRDYPALYAEAERIGNMERMREIFDAVICEIGGPYSAYIAAAGAEAGKRAAELMNKLHGAPELRGGKKV